MTFMTPTAAASILALVLVFRTSMALQRYMDGISNVLVMLSKWGDAYLQLIAFVNSSMTSGVSAEICKELLVLRCRLAHWFAMMSATALYTLEYGDPLDCSYFMVQKTGKRDSAMPKTARATVRGVDLHHNRFWVFHQPTEEEAEFLTSRRDKVSSLAQWVTEAVMIQNQKGNLKTPEPILSRCFQVIGEGLMGFGHARKISQMPFPFPFAQMLTVALVGVSMIVPFAVDAFTKGRVLTPILSFLVTLGYWGVNQIAVELENPFGGDANDLPLAEVHNDFVQLIEDLSLEIPKKCRDPEEQAEMDLRRIEDKVWARRRRTDRSTGMSGDSIEAYAGSVWEERWAKRMRDKQEASRLVHTQIAATQRAARHSLEQGYRSPHIAHNDRADRCPRCGGPGDRFELVPLPPLSQGALEPAGMPPPLLGSPGGEIADQPEAEPGTSDHPDGEHAIVHMGPIGVAPMVLGKV